MRTHKEIEQLQFNNYSFRIFQEEMMFHFFFAELIHISYIYIYIIYIYYIYIYIYTQYHTWALPGQTWMKPYTIVLAKDHVANYFDVHPTYSVDNKPSICEICHLGIVDLSGNQWCGIRICVSNPFRQ